MIRSSNWPRSMEQNMAQKRDNTESVYLLWHVNQGDEKLLGVYSTRESARTAKGILRAKPGFRKRPRGFHLDKYQLDKMQWTEGFITLKG